MRYRINSKPAFFFLLASCLIARTALGETNNESFLHNNTYDATVEISGSINQTCPQEEISISSRKWLQWWGFINNKNLSQTQKLRIWECIKPRINAMQKHFVVELNQFLFNGNFIYQNFSVAEAYLSSALENNYDQMRASQFNDVINFLAAEDPSWYLYGGFGPLDNFLTKKEQLRYYEIWLSTIGNDRAYLNDALPDVLLWGTSLGGTWADHNGHTRLQVDLAKLLKQLAETRFEHDIVFQSEAAFASANAALMQGDFEKAKAISLANAMKALSNPHAFKNTALELNFWISYFLGAATGTAAIHSSLGEHKTALRILDQALNVVKSDHETIYPYDFSKQDLVYEYLLLVEWMAIKADDLTSAARYKRERNSIYKEMPPPPLWSIDESIRSLLEIYYFIDQSDFVAADERIKQMFNRSKNLDWSVKDNELKFITFIAGQAANLGRVDLRANWMELATRHYLDDHKSRLSLEWPISVAEKTALTEFAFELIGIPEISDNLKFEFFQAIQELQVNESGFRQRAATQPGPAQISDIQRRLQDHEAYLSILNGESETFIWIVTNKNNEIIKTRLSRGEVNQAVTQALRDIDRYAYTHEHPSAGMLFKKTVQPFLIKYPDVNSLYITPSRELSRLPFSALPHQDSIKWLIETHAITHVPSPSFLTNQKKGVPATEKFFGIGAPLTGWNQTNNISYRDDLNRLKPLWDAKIELETLGEMFSEAVVLTGNDATEDQLSKIQTLRPQTISIATHSVVTSDDSTSTRSLLLNPGARSDGLVGPSEIRALDVSSTELIILTACNTADVATIGAQEAFTALAAEFIRAGAKNLILTYWPIESRTAMEISINTMRSSAPTYAEKLQDGIKLVMQVNPNVKKHPKYWGGLSILGSN